MLFNVILIVFIYFPYFSFGFTADEVTHLPGLAKQPTFKQYSGYLNASKGRYHHYWFVESQSNPQKDPVLLWLNGGPGASSLIGFWTENGPFRVKSNGTTLCQDPHSWNTIANVLYLESPVGVGYSYSDNNDNNSSDDSTAEDNYLSLQSFFKKFPQFSRNEFYITGESYAGVYIPMLAIKIFENNSKINLKGLAIGNGYFDWKIISNTQIRMAYTHGLIDSYLWNELVDSCCTSSDSTGQVCDFDPYQCNATIKVLMKFKADGINMYNINSDCPPPSHSPDNESLSISNYYGLNFEYMPDVAQYYSSESDCTGTQHVQYMNAPAVRKALHIPDQVPKWAQMSLYINKNYKKLLNMRTQFKQLVEKYRIQTFIVYNGVNDIVCDFLGDQQFLDELGYKLKQKYQKWTVGGRVAGFVKRYEGISFMTVRNAGHMVPTDQPLAALQIVKELIGVSKVN